METKNGWLASDGYDDFPFDFQGRVCHDLGFQSVRFVVYVHDGLFRQRRHRDPDGTADLQLVLYRGPLRRAGEPVVDADVQHHLADQFDTDVVNGHSSVDVPNDLDGSACDVDVSYLDDFGYPDSHILCPGNFGFVFDGYVSTGLDDHLIFFGDFANPFDCAC